ncbi:MAG: response regulator [Pirellulaceae bacterium]|nr:response regulator [Pirellulaceae bacterium]
MAAGRILIVDDDRDFAEGLADVLLPHGFDVELAFSAEDALTKFIEGNFDVTFMDVRLPGKNGVESFLEIRARKPHARVIMMTGYSVEQLLEQAVAGGAWAILHKPLNPERILRLLRDIVPAGILIADDDADSVQGIREILESQGYRVYAARDGREAIDRAGENDIDVLLLDLHMPILGGLEVYLELRRVGRAIPTIIVTAYAQEEAAALAKLRSLSVQGVLRKPFNPRDLVELVESLVGQEEDAR